MPVVLFVALGGALGASLRYLSGRALEGVGWPATTLFVNVAGSFAMGLLVAMFAVRGGHPAAPFLLTGVLGGFTTFSAFSLDTMMMIERGALGQALLYVAASVGLSLLAIAGGLLLGRGVSI